MQKTIIVVDDDQLITRTLKTLINITLHHNVVVFNDPTEAANCELIKNGEADMVISDFMMPGMTGLDLLKDIRKNNQKIVSILLTGYADKENAIRSINEVGLYYYLEKPWDNSQLMKIIQNGLEKKSLDEKLGQKVFELEQLNIELKGLNDILNEQYSSEVETNSFLQKLVNEKAFAVKNLLDNTGQGFLYFKNDLSVKNEYSKECERIFDEPIGGKNIVSLLFGEDETHAQLLTSALTDILSDPTGNMAELYLPLLPDTTFIKSKTIHIDYKMLDADMMIILTDVSNKIILENSFKSERDYFKMLLKASNYKNELIDVLNDFHVFCDSGLTELYNLNLPFESLLNTIFRQVHNFKGVFGQYNMQISVINFHKLEDEIENLKHDFENANNDSLIDNSLTNDVFYLQRLKKTANKDSLESCIIENLNQIEKELNFDFNSSNKEFYVKYDTYIWLEKVLHEKSSPEDYKRFSSELGKAYEVSVKKLLGIFPDYMLNLSEKLGKKIYNFNIEGDDVMVDSRHYSSFINSLVNVFKNAIDHGIETPEERLLFSKDEYGKIECFISKEGNLLHIRISDDGKGIPSNDDSSYLSTIFKEGFSTKSEATLVSGRGMGLPAVLEELKKIDGEVKVDSSEGIGTSFVFAFPITFL
jgi:two-component system chemotaxis sensor kinase CheA